MTLYECEKDEDGIVEEETITLSKEDVEIDETEEEISFTIDGDTAAELSNQRFEKAVETIKEQGPPQ